MQSASSQLAIGQCLNECPIVQYHFKESVPQIGQCTVRLHLALKTISEIWALRQPLGPSPMNKILAYNLTLRWNGQIKSVM